MKEIINNKKLNVKNIVYELKEFNSYTNENKTLKIINKKSKTRTDYNGYINKNNNNDLLFLLTLKNQNYFYQTTCEDDFLEQEINKSLNEILKSIININDEEDKKILSIIATDLYFNGEKNK